MEYNSDMVRAITILLLFFSGCASGSPPSRPFDRIPQLKLLQDGKGNTPKQIQGFKFLGSRQYTMGYKFNFKTPDNRQMTVLLRKSMPEKPAFSRTECGDLLYVGRAGARTALRLNKLMHELTIRIKLNCTSSLIARQHAVPSDLRRKLADNKDTYPLLPGAATSVIAAYILLAAWFLGLFLLIPRFRKAFGGDNIKYGWLLGLLVLAAISVRLFLFPHYMVMYYMGYRLTDYAANPWLVPKYGPGAFVFYHLLMRVFGVTHQVIQYTNSVIGPLSIALWGLLAVELGAPRLTALIIAIVLGFSPIFILDHNSESILIPAVMWYLSGSLGILAFMKGKGRRYLLVGLAGLAMAGFSRPEVLIVTYMTIPILAYAGSGAINKKALVWTLIFWAIITILFIPRLYHLVNCLTVEKARHNAPYTGQAPGISVILIKLWTRNILFRASTVPVLIPVFAGVFFVLTELKKHRVLAGFLLLLAIAWTSIYYMDLPYVSELRLQVPAVDIFVLISAWAAATWLKGLTGKRWPIITTLALVFALNAYGTSRRVFTNLLPYEEDRFLNAALPKLPQGPLVLVRIHYDKPEDRLPYQFPDYIVANPEKDRYVTSIDRIMDAGKIPYPIYFYLGTRCYTRECPKKGMHPACRRFMDAYRLKPVMEYEVNVPRPPADRIQRYIAQESDLPYCNSFKRIKLGLYRAIPKKEKVLGP